MMNLLSPRLRPCALMLACALLAQDCAAAASTGAASATVLPSNLSPSIALFVRMAPRAACFGDCAAAPAPPSVDVWPPAARLVGLSQDGVAQFSMSGATAATYAWSSAPPHTAPGRTAAVRRSR